MEGTANSPNSGNLFRKVVAVAAGEAHTLALTGDGRVFSWGRGMFGRLGQCSEDDGLFPAEVKFDTAPSDVKIVGVAAGAYHSLALAEDGSIWSWGYNIYGQLGIDRENTENENYTGGQQSSVPCLMEKFLDLANKSKGDLKVSSIKAGGMTSLAIDNRGTLWTWGNCLQKSNEEGNLKFVSTCTPIPVWDFHGHSVVKVACGNEHVVALVSVGEAYQDEGMVCYSWGDNKHGQLGLGNTDSHAHPQVVKTFTQDPSWAIFEVACGAFHTALLTRSKNVSDALESMCWTFGLGDKGQLGHGTTQSALYPTAVKELPQHVNLISVDCGLFHTTVVSLAGDVWSWGMEKGLGICPEASYAGPDAGDTLTPVLYSCGGPRQSKFRDPIQVSCGAAHTVLISDYGFRLWSWGRGKNGVLGTGKTVDFYTPKAVLWPPQTDGCRQKGIKDLREEDNNRGNNSEEDNKLEERLSLAMKEINLLQSKLSSVESYASILHGSIFGKPFEAEDMPVSLENSGTFDIAKEWENMLEAADHGKLIRLEMFYRNMLRGVKDKLLKRKIQEIIKDSLPS